MWKREWLEGFTLVEIGRRLMEWAEAHPIVNEPMIEIHLDRGTFEATINYWEPKP